MIGVDAFRLFGRVQRALGIAVWLNLVRRGRWRARVDRGLRFLGHEWFSSRHNVGIRSLDVVIRFPNPFRPGSDRRLTHDCSV
jgi:hypothetical protein